MVAFEERFQTARPAFQFERSVAGAGILLRIAQNIQNWNHFRLRVWSELRRHAKHLMDGKPLRARKIAARLAGVVPQPDAEAAAALDHDHAQAAGCDAVGCAGRIWLDLHLGGRRLPVDHEGCAAAQREPRLSVVKQKSACFLRQ